ncbi:hypothetical protein FraQA3DRAFT_4494 [Frankia sp. QA3]|nr:hypothetical protein FraQA3DRAFT_4494 [Frankia sp. QA3]
MPGDGSADLGGGFVTRLGLALTARIGGEMPGVDRDLVGAVVERVLELLAGSAATSRMHPLADPTVWLTAHALANPSLHRSLAGIRLNLPGLTASGEDFEREAVFFRRASEQQGPERPADPS